jgi:O-antigen ligase
MSRARGGVDAPTFTPRHAVEKRPGAASLRPSGGARVFEISLALFIALAVARIQDVIPALAYLRPGKLLTMLMVVAAVIAVPRWQLLSALRSTPAKCVGVIVVLGVLSVPMSIWPTNSAEFLTESLTPSLVLFVVASAGFADRRTARLCILVLVLSVGADAMYLLSGFAPERAGRPYIGATLDPNDSAALFVSALPFAMALASERGGKRWLALTVAALLIGAVVRTGSRGGVIGLLVVALILILRAGPRRRWAYVLAAAVGAGIFALAANETLLARFQTIFAPSSDYNLTDREGRIQIWTRGIGYMLTHPVFGIGLNNFQTAEGVLSGKINEGYGIGFTAAHNTFVQIGAELGVFGLAAFVVAIWSAGRGCRRIQLAAVRDHAVHPQLADEEVRLAAAAYCALAGVVATGFFLSLAYHLVTYFALAVCVGVWAGSPYATRDPLRKATPAPTRSPARRQRGRVRAGIVLAPQRSTSRGG